MRADSSCSGCAAPTRCDEVDRGGPQVPPRAASGSAAAPRTSFSSSPSSLTPEPRLTCRRSAMAGPFRSGEESPVDGQATPSNLNTLRRRSQNVRCCRLRGRSPCCLESLSNDLVTRADLKPPRNIPCRTSGGLPMPAGARRGVWGVPGDGHPQQDRRFPEVYMFLGSTTERRRVSQSHARACQLRGSRTLPEAVASAVRADGCQDDTAEVVYSTFMSREQVA